MGKGKDDAWRALIDFAAGSPPTDDREPWDVSTSPPKKKRRRKVSLSRALAQANRAGVEVKAATLTPEGGVTIEIGEADATKPNSWDDVQ
jgi:hypothetical protein